MAKNYIIELSPHTKKVIVAEPSEDGKKVVDVERNARDLEIVTLKNMFRFARNKESSLDTGWLITDCLDQLDNLKDEELIIKFTEQDIKFLKTGFTIAATEGTGLINFWFDHCKAVMRQIRKPVDEEEYLKQKESEIIISKEKKENKK